MNTGSRIAFMHSRHGKGVGKCKECSHFRVYRRGNSVVRKCAVFGISHSNATDWCSSFTACGLKNAQTNITDEYLQLRAERAKNLFSDDPLPGQIVIEVES